MTHSPSRMGDITEVKAIGWLLEQGYEVFRNAGCTGPADIVIWDVSSNTFTAVDVKRLTPYLCKDGSYSYSCGKYTRTDVRYLLYLSHQDSFAWLDEHKASIAA